MSVFWRLHATVIAITVLCFFGDCVLCAVEVYLQRKSLVDCVVVSLRIVEGTVFEAVRIAEVCNMSHVPAGLVGVRLLAHVYGVLQSYSDCISGGLST